VAYVDEKAKHAGKLDEDTEEANKGESDQLSPLSYPLEPAITRSDQAWEKAPGSNPCSHSVSRLLGFSDAALVEFQGRAQQIMQLEHPHRFFRGPDCVAPNL
jgi:hypothetical protein